jgi:ribonuclease P/MRP protein subunit POP1
LGGSRTLETHLYEPGGYPFALIAPVTIMWRPTSNAIREESQVAAPLEGKSKKNGKQQTSELPVAPLEELRTVWLRFHPSAQNEVLANLKTVASQILSKYKSNDSLAKDVNVEINDLKDRINAFEIMGPKASQVIKGALSPASHEKTEDFRKVCQPTSPQSRA